MVKRPNLSMVKIMRMPNLLTYQRRRTTSMRWYRPTSRTPEDGRIGRGRPASPLKSQEFRPDQGAYGGEFALRNVKTQEERWYLFADEWYKMNRRVKRSILIGDFNIDYDRSGKRLQAYQEPLRQSLREDFEEHGWQQLVRSPTRYQGDKSLLLDHIYCNIPNRVSYVINKTASTSDHNLVGVVIKVKNHFERDRQILVMNGLGQD